MSKSKCCNADIWGIGGNMSLRVYRCSDCQQEVTPQKGAPQPAPRRKLKKNYELDIRFDNIDIIGLPDCRCKGKDTTTCKIYHDKDDPEGTCCDDCAHEKKDKKSESNLSKYLKVLDMDKHLISSHIKTHKELLLFCKENDLILDLATSDVCIYIEDKTGGSICLG